MYITILCIKVSILFWAAICIERLSCQKVLLQS